MAYRGLGGVLTPDVAGGSGLGSNIRAMATREERIAETEALFRAGNDRMAMWPESQKRLQNGETLPFFCECGRRDCHMHVWLTGPRYESVRSDPRRFLV